LLAQKVLLGTTKGYRSHPQLERFRATSNPLEAIGPYLRFVLDEAKLRDYDFDSSKIKAVRCSISLPIASEQLAFEFKHLNTKLSVRNLEWLRGISTKDITPHPMLYRVPSPIQPWEIIRDRSN